MRALKLSVAGVRGVVGAILIPDLLVDFGQAFATYVGGVVRMSWLVVIRATPGRWSLLAWPPA